MFAFGVGAGLGLSIMMGQEPLEIVVPESYDVLGAQSGTEVMNTEQGTIEVHCSNLPAVLPLCITQDVLDSWFVCVAVTGGYEPLGGIITLSQKGIEVADICVSWWNWDSFGCDGEYWRADFTLVGEEECILLDSNQWPAGAVPLEDNPTIPGKEVTIDWCSLWKGCEDRNQMFTLIQTQKSDVFRVPSSE